jgi:hypothetical protein
VTPTIPFALAPLHCTCLRFCVLRPVSCSLLLPAPAAPSTESRRRFVGVSTHHQQQQQYLSQPPPPPPVRAGRGLCAERHAIRFECFPYVCPELVLVK